MITSFYSEEELKGIGLKSLGNGVKISRNAKIYSPSNISIGNNVRIDDFCILCGKIVFGSHIHIAPYCAFYGGREGIDIEDFANISSRCCIYAQSDDYTGETLTNPTIPDQYKNVKMGHVHIGKHVIVGSTSVILPNSDLKEGSAFGAFSLINHDSEPWSINAGIPFVKLKARKKDLLKLEKEYISNL